MSTDRAVGVLANLSLSLCDIVDLTLVPVPGPLHHLQAREQGVLLLLQLLHLLQLWESWKRGHVVGVWKKKAAQEKSERQKLVQNTSHFPYGFHRPDLIERKHSTFIFPMQAAFRLLPRLNLIIDCEQPAVYVVDKLPSFHKGICSKLFCVGGDNGAIPIVQHSLPSWTTFRGAISPASWQLCSNLRMG